MQFASIPFSNLTKTRISTIYKFIIYWRLKRKKNTTYTKYKKCLLGAKLIPIIHELDIANSELEIAQSIIKFQILEKIYHQLYNF
jgi:hypothetical protein